MLSHVLFLYVIIKSKTKATLVKAGTGDLLPLFYPLLINPFDVGIPPWA